MRLINVDTLELKQFFDSYVPEYAILSHTWTGQEITLQEFQACADPASPLRQTAGYVKIKQACHLSRELGYTWCWVDTNCIDKTSSVELSEAINSMFRWYAESKVCIVYLEDYEYKIGTDADITACRWLTRGWCLQELIAPKTVSFYDHQWKQFATKSELSSQLATYTGIDRGLLGGLTYLDEYPVACRMSWAAHRKTSRLEDQAYCLLGLLDVNMPLLYGEGSKAFARLQQELLRAQDDPSILLWGSGDLSRQPLLAPDVSHFAQSFRARFTGHPGQESQVRLTGTSRGIHVRGAKMRLLFKGEGPAYLLPFPSVTWAGGLYGAGVHMCLMLRKCGVGTYGRISWSGYDDASIVDSASPEEEFVIADNFLTGPSICMEIAEHSDWLPVVGITAEPRAAWDTLRSRFFVNPVEKFVGYLRFHPIITRSYGPSSESFVLTIVAKPQHEADAENALRLHLIPGSTWDLYTVFHRNPELCVELVTGHEEALEVSGDPAGQAIGSLTLNVIIRSRNLIDVAWSRRDIDS